MDPVTHAVIGVAITKITGSSIALSEPASVGLVIGSVFPDIDILLQKWGDYAYLKNHRGVTHSIFGLIASAVLITDVLAFVYPHSNGISIFLWALLGCFSHSIFDLFNSYGAKLLWPFSNKKYTFSLLIIFDPIIILALSGFVMCEGTVQTIFLASAVLYLAVRAITRFKIGAQLKRKFPDCKSVSVLPSMTGLLRWHFVLEKDECNIIGEKNILKRDIVIREKLNKLHDEKLDKIMFSKIGRFFRDFTPLCHVVREKTGGATRYVFIDMRYYVGNNFLHHAVLELDDNNRVVRESFNPYSMNRSSPLKIK